MLASQHNVDAPRDGAEQALHLHLLMPREVLSAHPTIFVDAGASPYRRFKNTLAALNPQGSDASPEDGQPQAAALESA